MIGELAALATAILWSWTAIFFTSAGRQVGSFAVNLIRLVFGVIFLLLTHYLLIGDYSVSSQGFYSLAASGLIGLVVGDLTLFKAFVILGPRRSLLIMALVPAFTSVMAFLFLHEVLSAKDIFAITITIIGIAWTLSESKQKQEKIHGSLISGVVLAVAGALCQAGGLVVAKHGLNDQVLDPLNATLIRMVAALIGMSLLMVFTNRTRNVAKAALSGRPLLLILAGSVVGPFLGVWMSMVAIKYTNTGIGATIMATSPIIVIPFSVLYLKERPSGRAIWGSVVAVLGVAFLFW